MTSPKRIAAGKQSEVSKRTVAQNAQKAIAVVDKNLRSKPVFIILNIITACLFFVVLFMNLLAADPSLSKGLFLNGIANTSNKFPLNITPAGWAFSIWGFIYLNQFAWILYNLALICRSTTEGPAYLHPIILSPGFLIFFNISSLFNIGWLFLWDRELFMASFVFSACISLSLILSLAIVSLRLVHFIDTLVDQGRQKEATFLQVAVINGLGFYATWSVIATLLNLGVVLTYKWSHTILNEKASVITMLTLLSLFFIYAFLDLFSFERYTRYNFAPYLTIAWAMSAAIAKNYDSSNLSSIALVVLLSVASLFGLIKVALTGYRMNQVTYQYRQMKLGRPSTVNS